MQTFGLVIFAVVGMALFAGLSMALYMVLPQSVLECGARHGRFAGLGTRDTENQTPAGSVRVSTFDALQGQSA